MSDLRQLHLLGALGAVRTEMWDGREHLVIPCVALQEGVVHAVNSKTPEFVGVGALTASVNKWAGHPIVVGHPTRDGQQISAHDPAVMEKHACGFIRQAHMKGTRLGMEAMIDPARLEKLEQRQLLADLRAGKQVEISVGAFVRTNGNKSTHLGKSYDGEWAEINPDHTALLPNGTGACSIASGCGANRAAMLVTAEGFEALSNPEGINQYSHGGQTSAEKARTPAEHQAAADHHRDTAKLESSRGRHEAASAHNYAVSAQQNAANGLRGWSSSARKASEKAGKASLRADVKFSRGLEEFEALSNPEGINQYSHDGASAAHEEARNAHKDAQAANKEAAKPGASARVKEIADSKSSKADQLSRNADKMTQGINDKGMTRVKGESTAARHSAEDANRANSESDHPTSHDFSRAADHHASAMIAHREASVSHQLKQKGVKGLSMNLKSLRAKMLALFDTPEQAASEEAAELVGYQTLKTMAEACGASCDQIMSTIDELIADEEENPTETRQQEDAETEVEQARLESISMLCMTMMSGCSAMMQQVNKMLAPDMADMPVSDPRYMEQFKALVGKSISAANMKKVQAAHDTSHDLHTHTVALGAACNGMKLLEAAEFRAAETCKCGGHSAEGELNMDRKAHIAALLALSGANFTDDQKKGIEYLPDANLASLHTLAGKSPADSIIQAKAAADAALAGHAHGLNAMDLAAKAKQDAADKAKEDAADGGKDDAKEGKDGKMKAAQAAGFKTVEEHEEAVWLAAHPSLKTLVDKQQKQDADRRVALVAALKGGPLTEKQLEAKPLDELETLAAYAKVETIDYSGRGLAMHDEKDVYANPPNPYSEEALAKRRAVN